MAGAVRAANQDGALVAIIADEDTITVRPGVPDVEGC